MNSYADKFLVIPFSTLSFTFFVASLYLFLLCGIVFTEYFNLFLLVWVVGAFYCAYLSYEFFRRVVDIYHV